MGVLRWGSGGVRAAAELFGEATSKTLRQTILVRKYATLKLDAMFARLDGRITAALVYEQACDTLYNSMPGDMQW